MKLSKTSVRPATAGLPPRHNEWWDINGNYEIYVSFGKDECLIAVEEIGNKDITYEIGRLLGINTDVKNINFSRPKDNPELYFIAGIDCVAIGYANPESYKRLLKRIEEIINKHFKSHNPC